MQWPVEQQRPPGQREGRPRSVVPYLLVIAFALLPILAFLLAGVFGSHSVPKGECEGIGEGCRMSPADNALFALMFMVGPLVAIWTAAMLILLAILRHWTRYRRWPEILQGFTLMSPLLILLAIGLVAVLTGQ